MELTIRAATVRCRKISPQPLIPLDLCQSCEFHRGLQTAMPASNGRAPVLEIKCGFPMAVRIEYIVTPENYEPERLLNISTKAIEQEDNNGAHVHME